MNILWIIVIGFVASLYDWRDGWCRGRAVRLASAGIPRHH